MGVDVNQREQRCLRFDIAPPAWVGEWTGAARTVRRSLDGLKLEIAQGTGASLVAVTAPGAAGLVADAFEEVTLDVYRAVRSALATLPHRVPVRFWNYLPAIHEPMGGGRDRYMVFNAGRYRAMSDWFGGASQLAGRLPAASAVGHAGDDLVVHCLAGAEGGNMVENPRQIPAIQYSRRYGPRPPCFARAIVVAHPCGGRRTLLVAGTASILGERSVHANDLERQLEETFANLRALLAAAEGTGPPWAFSDLRAYYVRLGDAAMIGGFIEDALGATVNVESVQADLCRQDLLVEIEGRATPSAFGGGGG
jgi:chorismate lyase / 3-hydroxybenzoate synthase